MRTIEDELRDLIVEHFCFGQRDSFSDSDSFLQKGILDSTGMMELVSFIECTYGIVLDDGELIPENLDCVDSVARFVRSKTAAQQAEVKLISQSED